MDPFSGAKGSPAMDKQCKSWPQNELANREKGVQRDEIKKIEKKQKGGTVKFP